MKQQIPPLQIWYVVLPLAVAILFLVGLQSTADPFYGKERNHLVFQKRLAHFLNDMKENAYPKECRVLCWGSSLTEQAINFSDTLRENISNKTGQNIGVYKMFMENLTAGQFQYLDELFNASLELNPQLILIESFILIEKEQRSFMSTDIFSRYKTTIKERFFPSEIKPIRKKHYAENFDRFNRRLRKPKNIDTTYIATKIRTIAKYEDVNWIEKKLKPFKDRHIPIIIIDIPRVGNLEKTVQTPKNKNKKEALVTAMRAAGFIVDYWSFDTFLPYSYYTDYAHTNEKGMRYYSNWLTDKITHYFSQQCSN